MRNLVKITPETAQAMGRKGGAVRSDAQTWKNQKYCKSTCVFYDRCPAISSSKAGTIVRKNNMDCYPCFIKSQPKEVQHYFVNLFANGEDGLIKLILDLHFRLMLKLGKEASIKALRDGIETTLAMKKGIYGDKQKIDISGRVEGEITHKIDIKAEVKRYITALELLPQEDIIEIIEVQK